MTTADFVDFQEPGRRSPEAKSGRTMGGRVTAGKAVLAVVARFRRWRTLNRSVGELQGLNDRMLKDIGLSRSVIYSAARDAYDGRNEDVGG